jgi:hypothetical protein
MFMTEHSLPVSPQEDRAWQEREAVLRSNPQLGTFYELSVQ